MKSFKFIFSFYLIFLFSGELLAQDSLKNNHNWIINVLVAPDYTYRFAHHKPADKGYAPHFYQWSYKTSDQIGKEGWHLGLSLSRKITQNFYFQTGLIVSQKGYNSKIFNDTTLVGKPLKTSVKDGQIGYNFYFIGIPLFIQYEKEIKNDLFIGLTAGVISNFREYGREYRFGALVGNIGFEDEGWPLFAYGKIDFIYQYEPNKAFTLSPTFNFAIQPTRDYYTIDGQYYNLHLFSAGIEVAFHYYMGKKK